ncbi:MAG: hypothetical protein ABSA80_19765 [Terriglobales bacterium]|jgi:hypothetical protein
MFTMKELVAHRVLLAAAVLLRPAAEIVLVGCNSSFWFASRNVEPSEGSCRSRQTGIAKGEYTRAKSIDAQNNRLTVLRVDGSETTWCCNYFSLFGL